MSHARRRRRTATGRCPCCAHHGVLPGTPVPNPFTGQTTQAVSSEVAKHMCEACLEAAFIPGGRPHPHPIAPEVRRGQP